MSKLWKRMAQVTLSVVSAAALFGAALSQGSYAVDEREGGGPALEDAEKGLLDYPEPGDGMPAQVVPEYGPLEEPVEPEGFDIPVGAPDAGASPKRVAALPGTGAQAAGEVSYSNNGSVSYMPFNAAWDSAIRKNGNQVITLQQDVTVTRDLTIGDMGAQGTAGQLIITINLNGHTLIYDMDAMAGAYPIHMNRWADSGMRIVGGAGKPVVKKEAASAPGNPSWNQSTLTAVWYEAVSDDDTNVSWLKCMGTFSNMGRVHFKSSRSAYGIWNEIGTMELDSVLFTGSGDVLGFLNTTYPDHWAKVTDCVAAGFGAKGEGYPSDIRSGALFACSNTTVKNSYILNCGGLVGGGIRHAEGTLSLDGVTIAGCFSRQGGGIFSHSNGHKLLFSGENRITQCRATYDGGGLEAGTWTNIIQSGSLYLTGNTGGTQASTDGTMRGGGGMVLSDTGWSSSADAKLYLLANVSNYGEGAAWVNNIQSGDMRHVRVLFNQGDTSVSDPGSGRRYGSFFLQGGNSGTVTDIRLVGNTGSGGMGVYDTPVGVSGLYAERNSGAFCGGGFYLYNARGGYANVTCNSNSASGSGGGVGITNFGNGTLTGVSCTGNTAAQDGGGIYSERNFMRMSNVTLANNRASGDGGGFCGVRWEASISGFSVSGNSAGGSGGGAWFEAQNDSSTANAGVVSGASITGNTAGADGGGLYSCGLLGLSLSGTEVSGNTCGTAAETAYGGGICATKRGPFSISGMDIKDNSIKSASGDGGGIYVDRAFSFPGGSPKAVTVSGNSCPGNGGGIYCSGDIGQGNTGSLVFSGNRAGKNGGGASCQAFTEGRDIHFLDNTAGGNGGGISCTSIACRDLEAARNQAGGNGGGVCGNISGSGILLYENIAGQDGGGSSGNISNAVKSSRSAYGLHVHDNQAGRDGGGVDGSLSGSDVLVCDNTAVSGKGGGCWGITGGSRIEVCRNQANAGGGVYGSASGNSLSVHDNTAETDCGGVRWGVSGNTVEVYGNRAETGSTGGCGGINGGNGILVHGNYAYVDGGGVNGSVSGNHIKIYQNVSETGSIAGCKDIHDSNTVEVYGNTAHVDGGGVYGEISGSEHVSVHENLSETGGFSGCMGIQDSSYVEVRDNTCERSGAGVCGSVSGVSSLTVSGNVSRSGSGAGIFGSVSGKQVFVEGNHAEAGKAAGILGTTVSIEGGEVSGNVSGEGPGGIGVVGSDSSSVSLSGVTVSENVSPGGGGVYLSGEDGKPSNGKCVVKGCTVSKNVSPEGDGGGIYAYTYGDFDGSGSTVSGNSCKGNGGGVYYAPGGVLLYDGNRKYPDAPPKGVLPYSKGVFSSMTVSGNTADGSGGGIYAWGPFTASSLTVSGNTALRDGGGVYLRHRYRKFENPDLGLVIFSADGVDTGSMYGAIPVYFSNLTLTDNLSSGNGGGMYLPDLVDITMKGNTTVTGNRAYGRSGGILWEDAEIYKDTDPETFLRTEHTVGDLHMAGKVSIQDNHDQGDSPRRNFRIPSGREILRLADGIIQEGSVFHLDMNPKPEGIKGTAVYEFGKDEYDESYDGKTVAFAEMFKSDHGDYIVRQDFDDLSVVTLYDRYDHTGTFGIDELWTFTGEEEEAGNAALLEAAEAFRETGVCRHGFSSVGKCRICGAGRVDLSGSVKVDDSLELDHVGVGDLLEGVFDINLAIAPYKLFQLGENGALEEIPLSVMRFGQMEPGKHYLADYLVSTGSGETGYLTRAFYTLPEQKMSITYIPEAKEAAYYMRYKDHIGTLQECWDLMAKDGGAVALMSDASFAPGALLDVERDSVISGLYLFGHEAVPANGIQVSRPFALADASRLDVTSTAVTGAVPFAREGDTLTWGSSAAGEEDGSYIYRKREASLSHMGHLSAGNGFSGKQLLDASGYFAMGGVVLESPVGGVLWSQGRAFGNFDSCVLLGHGEGIGFYARQMRLTCTFKNGITAGFSDGVGFSCESSAAPEPEVDRWHFLANSSQNFYTAGAGAGVPEFINCQFSWGGQGVQTERGIGWRMGFTSCEFSHNSGAERGAGMRLYAQAELSGCRFLFNESSMDGGGISLADGCSLLAGEKPTDICGNISARYGGGLCAGDGFKDEVPEDAIQDFRATLFAAKCWGNQAAYGGFCFTGMERDCQPVVFTGDLRAVQNTATEKGGGFYLSGSKARLPQKFQVVDNTCEGQPDNIYVSGEYLIQILQDIDSTSKAGVSVSRKPSSLREFGLAETADRTPAAAGQPCFIPEGNIKSDLYSVYVGTLPRTLVIRVRGAEGSSALEALVHMQFRASMDVLATAPNGKTVGTLQVVNTATGLGRRENPQGGSLPQNGTGMVGASKTDFVSPTGRPWRNIYLDKNGNVQYDHQVRQIYTPYDYSMRDGDGIYMVNPFLGDGYKAHEVWVLKPGHDAQSEDPADWTVYPYSQDIKFTVSDIPGAIKVSAGDTVRIVAVPGDGFRDQASSFYDYDISDGQIYLSQADAVAQKHGQPTSTQPDVTGLTALASAKVRYMSNLRQGVNSESNYPEKVLAKSGSYGFGNANTGSFRTKETSSDGHYINQTDKGNVANDHKACNAYGCFFGLVRQVSAFQPVFRNDILAPNLFTGDPEGPNGTDTVGVTAYEDGEYSLRFRTYGYVNTLRNVTQHKKGGVECENLYYPDEGKQNLESFFHPSWKPGNSYDNIWTNNFWVMDMADSYGTDGHDMKFGYPDIAGTGRYGSGNKHRLRADRGTDSSYTDYRLPSADDGTDHNAFFGMKTKFTFQTPDGYSGPLEFLFYGDDDLWVFLDGELICDIGGVHSSVGEYVDFWDYIDMNDHNKHTVEVFYTERGASGSSCWMQYTLPGIVGDGEDEYRSIVLSKSLGNEPEEGMEHTGGYRFLLEAGTSVTNMSPYIGAYEMHDTECETENGVIGPIDIGQHLVVPDVPVGTVFKITEYWEDGHRPDFWDEPVIRVLDGSAVAVEGATGEVTNGDAVCRVDVQNFYAGHWNLDLLKMDRDARKPMKGVAFTMQPLGDDGTPYGEVTREVTDASGHLTFTGFKKGQWLVTEETPKGYAHAGPWVARVNQTGDLELYTAEEAGGKYTAAGEVSITGDGSNTYSFRCWNDPEGHSFGLPETGGRAVHVWLLGTGVLLACGVFSLRRRKR